MLCATTTKPEVQGAQGIPRAKTGSFLASFLFLLLYLFAQPLAAQSPEVLEAQLETAVGEARIEILVALASHYLEDDPEKTMAFATEALEILEVHPHVGRQIEMLLCLSEACDNLEEYEDASSYASRAESLAASLDDPALLARTRHQLADILVHLDRLEQASDLFLSAKNLYKEAGDMDGAGEVLRSAGISLVSLNEYDRAFPLFLEAAECFRKTNNHARLGSSLARAGRVLSLQGRYKEALDLYLQSYDWFLKEGSPGNIATGLHNIGIIYGRMGETEKALNFYHQALEVNRTEDRRLSIAANLNSIGVVYTGLDRYEEAIEALEEGLEIRQAAGRPGGPLFVHLANAYQGLGDLDKAEEIYQQGLEEGRRLENEAWTAYNLLGLGWILEEREELLEALESAREGLDSSQKISSRDAIQEFQLLISEIYAGLGRHEEALEMFKLHTETQREIFDEESQRVMLEMQARFDAEQKEKEIERLEYQQELSALELQRQQSTRRALLVGFGLVSLIAFLSFNRYRLKAREALILETVRQEKEVSHRLREIDKLKDDFLANTSHELRTPLFGITGLAESLIDGAAGNVPQAIRTHLEMISASGRRLTALVGDLLDFSKLKHQGLELVLRPVELHALADVVLTMSRPLAEGKELNLVNAIEPHLPAAQADERRVHQILLNLVGNAIKFTEWGQVTVSAEPCGEELEVRVADTGIGIPEEHLERIFESFEQANASVEREYGGTGLGLAISRQLVELHGGRIWAESEPNQGAVLAFTLPIAQEEDFAVGTEEPRQPPPVFEPSPSRAITVSEQEEVPEGPLILAVDDEPVVRQVLVNHLTTEGYRVRQASSGSEALRVLENETIDLMLLDVMMPRMSGYEVCRKIRQRHPREELPILFLSAKDRNSDREMGLAEGANDYLSKPISKGELLLRVGAHLELLQAHRHKLSEVKVLRGLLPICSGCKKIRDDQGYWNEIETYIDAHSEAEFTHGMCLECAETMLEELGLDVEVAKFREQMERNREAS